ncbi:response regulator [Luteimonas kalidii]|uniref:Response regulator n=1 Tax=Luteimonas kalidii TaxID=3042025 RepID=A0ABT6JX75_9GAMM|nr:response regulator [Luteimonas kalidii]MDH5835080.1 response regulator [Luteimonas kalidii]
MAAGSASGSGRGDGDWRVLLVDDSRDDAELAEYALRKGGLAVDCRRVYTGAALAEALQAFAPHAVVCDVNLPGFSGVEALALVRAHDPALPFVFLTGGLAPDGDPPAADGLLLKDDLDALPGVLRPLLATATPRNP